MSRQQDRRDHELPVRVSWLEADLDRVDERFTETAGRIDHTRNNSTMALKGLETRLELYTDKLETKVERIERETDHRIDSLAKSTSEEIAGNRKVMVGVLISTLSVAIAIVAQVVIMRGGS